jgi:hypothetical protein
MTSPLINRAREIVFLVSGQDKTMILKAILEGPPGRFQAQEIRSLHGNLTWLLDQGRLRCSTCDGEVIENSSGLQGRRQFLQHVAFKDHL